MGNQKKSKSEQEVATHPHRPVTSRLNSLPAVRREMIRVYKDTREGRIPAAEGSKLTFMLLSISKQLELESQAAAVTNDADLGAKNVYGIPAWISKEEWTRKYSPGPVTVIRNGHPVTSHKGPTT